MSFDLYLVPLQSSDGIDEAMATFDRLEGGGADRAPGSVDVRKAADVLQGMDSRYKAFDLDHDEIARAMNIPIADAKAKYNYVEMNGPEEADVPLAQFTFHADRVVVHWYEGTTEAELFGYLKAICRQTGLSLVDPQDGKVYRLGSDGEFA